MSGAERVFRYLDGDQERRDLVADIRRVRRAVIQMAENMPDERRYEPRYQGLTLAALLAHLHVSDRMTMIGIQLALFGLPPFHVRVLDPFNELTARLFKHRVIESTLGDIRRNERHIADFILSLPIEKFSKPVYDPEHDVTLTVEQTLQESFLFHWQEHFAAMQRVEGIYYEPPERFDTL